MGDSMSIAELIKQANRKYGDGFLIKGSDIRDDVMQRASTGSLSFDIMLGGGWPLNKWNEIVGNPSNGKTVMVLKTIAAQQALNPDYETLWIAAEDFVPDWAERLGVNLDKVYVADTNVSEQAFQLVNDALDDRAVDAVIIDSLPALVPGDEAERAAGEWLPGLQARLTGQFMRKTGKTIRRSLTEDDRPVLALIINQWRDQIGVMYGDPRTTPGGKAKNFSYFTRVEVSRDDWLRDVSKNRVGISIKAKTMKNKTAPPQRVGVVDFYFSDTDGFSAGDYDSVKEIFSVGQAYGVIERGGSYYSFNGERLNDKAGKEEAENRLRYDLDLQDQIRAEVFRVVLHQSVDK